MALNREFALCFQTKLPLEQSLALLQKFLCAEGFRIASELWVDEEIQRHLGLRWPRSVILVAWNPFVAYQSLLTDPDAGIFIPLHFTLTENGAYTAVAATNYTLFARLSGRMGLQLLARELMGKIRQFFGQLAAREESASSKSVHAATREAP